LRPIRGRERKREREREREREKVRILESTKAAAIIECVIVIASRD